MEKDTLANLASFGALGAYMANIESILAILALATAIVLNIVRMRNALKDKDTKKEE